MRLPIYRPTWSRLEGIYARTEQTACHRVVDFSDDVAPGYPVAYFSWRARDHRQVERAAQHDTADGRAIVRADPYMQALCQFFHARELHRLYRWRLSRERRPKRALSRALQIRLHVFRRERRELAWGQLERRTHRQLSARHRFPRILGRAARDDACHSPLRYRTRYTLFHLRDVLKPP